MKEKLQEYALLAEIIGGVAIVASLVFVGIQVNQNYEMMKAQTRSELSQALSQRMWEAANSGYFHVINFNTDPDSLDELDRNRQQVGIFSIFRLYENMYYQYKNGLFDEEEFSAEVNSWRGVINSKAAREIFCSAFGTWSEDFREFMVGMMEVPCETP